MFFGLRSYCFLICVLMVSSARAGFILNIDLSTVNQVTISATTELSLATKIGDDSLGVYLKDFFGTSVFSTSGATRLPGADLVYFNATSGGTPSLFRNGGSDPGLNIYSMDNDTPSTASFTAGVQAFKGSATWSLTASAYSVFLLAPTSGDVYAFADELSDLNGGPLVIGQYGDSGISAVPEPTSVAIFGLGGLGMVYLARRKRKV
jgi:PEP-CTERM motif